MRQLPFRNASNDGNSRLFGLRIESHLLQVAVATPTKGGRYRLEIDDIRCSSESGWLSPTGNHLLAEALATLAERHDMRRGRVAVSLDGDFCVIRAAMGSIDEVDHELATLADRIPRYLQLGPGEKVTGVARTRVEASVDYAVTGVVNRNLIQLIYDSLRTVDVEIAWVEPSLVGVARMVGLANIGQGKPIMIADGTGQQWDVGITHNGRMLLDYRPAAATTEQGFRDALEGHLARLKRFCHRHRRITSGELERLLMCGSGEKLQRAAEAFGEAGIEPEILNVPEMPEVYVLQSGQEDSSYVPAVASVLPLLVEVDEDEVPDMLSEVRRAPELPWHIRLLSAGWPAIAAALVLCISFGLVSGERSRAAQVADQRIKMETAFEATQIRFNDLSGKRRLVGYLREIDEKQVQEDFNRLLGWITQSLPDTGKLNEFRVEAEGVIRLDGTVIDEAAVYELVESLRFMPGITQVALKGTSPDGETGGTRFVIRLTTLSPERAELRTQYE